MNYNLKHYSYIGDCVWELFVRKHVINKVQKDYKMPSVLVNFDSHSDLYYKDTKESSLANWVNFAISLLSVPTFSLIIPNFDPGFANIIFFKFFGVNFIYFDFFVIINCFGV